jgi:hypothetical protein
MIYMREENVAPNEATLLRIVNMLSVDLAVGH